MNEIIDLFRAHNNFVLAGHISPDGDCIGSCFSLALALHNMGKKVRVVLEPFARKYEIIPGREFWFRGDIETLTPEVFVALDCAEVGRLGAAVSLFERAEVTVCIDHHETNIGFADYNYIEADASSASEMTSAIIEKLTETTPAMAAAVYAGMVSDTGGFRYNATAKSTMETAARLMEMIPFTHIYNELMHVHRFAAGKALGVALENSGRSANKKIVHTFMSREMMKNTGANPSDLDGVVEYLMGTRKALVAIFVYERSTSTGVKVSMRSKGPSVGRIATAMGGGGHALAAGATVNSEIEEALQTAITLAAQEITAFENEILLATRKTGLTGVINIHKEKGCTSHDVVAFVRRTTRAKAGHTGTLDPDATGVLPICIGRATKLADYFAAADKSYLAEIVTGVVTDTGDMSGNVLSRNEAHVDFEKLKEVAESFKFENRGEYLQVPPMYSAVRVNGQRLYELARKGETVERKPRPVKILDLTVLPPREDGKIFMEVTCSKGTYIRSLCMDIGEVLGCGAVMGELVRTRSGIFPIENSFSLDEVKSVAECGRLDEVIMPVTQVLPYAFAYVNPDGLARALNGNPLPAEFVSSENTIELDERCWIFDDCQNQLIGLYTRTQNNFRAEVMF